MKIVMKNFLKPTKGVIIRDLDKNMFSLQVFSAVDKRFVLDEGPWAFDCHILLLK